MDARYNQIKEMRESGMTWDKIGLHFCVTGNRAWQIYHMADRKSKYESCGLDTKTYNTLRRSLHVTANNFPECGLPKFVPDGNVLKKELVKHLNSGNPLLLCCGFGKKTRAFTEEFLNMKLETTVITGKGIALRRADDT